MKRFILQLCQLDIRSTALLRACIGILVAKAAVNSLTLHQVETALPSVANQEKASSFLGLSLHSLIDNNLWWGLLCIALCVSAIAFAIGYQTRIANWVMFILLGSLLNADGFAAQISNQLLMTMVFWCLFLPTYSCFSIDSALSYGNKVDPNIFYSNWAYSTLVSIAVCIQISIVVFFLIIHDSFGIFSTHVKLLTIFGVVVFSLILIRSKDASQNITQKAVLTRIFLLLFFSILAMAILMQDILFATVLLASLTLLIPTSFWNQINSAAFLETNKNKASANKQVKPENHFSHITLYYDTDCGFCLKMCLILREFLLNNDNKIYPAQSDPIIGEILERENSWVVTDANEKPHVHWDAILLIFKQRVIWRPAYWFLSIPGLPAAGHRLYRWIADNRPTVSKITAILLPWTGMKKHPSLIGGTFAVFWILIIVSYNLSGGMNTESPFSKFIEIPAHFAGVQQRWEILSTN